MDEQSSRVWFRFARAWGGVPMAKRLVLLGFLLIVGWMSDIAMSRNTKAILVFLGTAALYAIVIIKFAAQYPQLVFTGGVVLGVVLGMFILIGFLFGGKKD